MQLHIEFFEVWFFYDYVMLHKIQLTTVAFYSDKIDII